jgi:pilus assembly protein FimV
LAGETTDDSHESTVTMDMSLDLEFQEAETTQSELGAGSDASSGDADDPAETALELALAYIDMGDKVGASELLQTALSAGDAAQRQRAQSLLESLE